MRRGEGHTGVKVVPDDGTQEPSLLMSEDANLGLRVTRREFVSSLAWAGTALVPGVRALGGDAPAKRIKLGIDNFSVRAMNWDAPQLIDYAASLKLDTLFITDLKPFASFEEPYLKELRAKAAGQGVQIYLGSWSICPTSKAFKKDWGTAEEHLQLGIRMARALGSPVFRVVLGTREDRQTEGGIQARIRDTVKVLKSGRSRAVDAGVKIAVENHAGDMQARELVGLIEEAGRDYVGANLDSGNATWTLEEPVQSLEILGPYALCSSLRDSMVWEDPDGAKVQWTAMGEGNTDLKAYFNRFAVLCPDVPANIETISGFAVGFPYLKPEFWNNWPTMLARDLAPFLALARTGKPLAPHRSANDQEEREYQKAQLEQSVRYCREVLGLGVRR
jgi:3-oxoisoapionate decarboxylase